MNLKTFQKNKQLSLKNKKFKYKTYLNNAMNSNMIKNNQRMNLIESMK